MKISLCIATFKRPERLESMLALLTRQTFSDFEVVISDNDVHGSAEPAIKIGIAAGLQINYAINEKNLGMVKSFNRSLNRASGEYTIFITDDDPLREDALETLVALSLKHPGHAAYYGGAGTLIESIESAEENGLPVGFHSELGNNQPDEIRVFNGLEGFDAVLAHEIFPHLLWSAGMIRREVALKVGGMSDYGSPHMADHFYIALSCLHGGLVTINKIVATRVLHTSNYSKCGREILADVASAARNFMQEKIAQSEISFTPAVLTKVDAYIAHWALSYLCWLRKIAKYDPEIAAMLGVQVRALKHIPGFGKLWPRYLIRGYFPFLGRFIHYIKSKSSPTISG